MHTILIYKQNKKDMAEQIKVEFSKEILTILEKLEKSERISEITISQKPIQLNQNTFG